MAKKKGSETAAETKQTAKEVYAELASQGKGQIDLEEAIETAPVAPKPEGQSDADRVKELEAKLARAENMLARKGMTSGESPLRPITFDPNDDDPILDEPVLGPGKTEIRSKTGSGGRGEPISVPTWRELGVHPRDVDDGPKLDAEGRKLPCRFIKKNTGNLVEWR